MDEQKMQHGAFSWNELVTKDVAGAKEFYAELIGWTTQDMPMENGNYTIFKDGDKYIGGMMSMPEQANGSMPTWISYITVDDVDARIKRAQSLGATLLVAPRDIPEVGRFGVIQDPTGAPVSLITYTC